MSVAAFQTEVDTQPIPTTTPPPMLSLVPISGGGGALSPSTPAARPSMRVAGPARIEGERLSPDSREPTRPGQEGLRAMCGIEDFGPRSTSTADLPQAREWSARMGLAIAEAACGARPTLQVMRWVSPSVYESLVRRSARAVQHRRATRRPMRVRRVRVCHPCDGVAEATVIIEDHHRVRALAIRMQGIDGRWIITECRLG
ncbi:Rv3235 family protein [Gephyromycinifex aptenodytis]|uniref:Rv3235 family protein n=1 Tax=Gephyromycinifex aptenodytis TaxID=2716227 RepID=UPI001446D13B|nr:Rv3235 family protein [Gephyromycinifex aptenodytis]